MTWSYQEFYILQVNLWWMICSLECRKGVRCPWAGSWELDEAAPLGYTQIFIFAIQFLIYQRAVNSRSTDNISIDNPRTGNVMVQQNVMFLRKSESCCPFTKCYRSVRLPINVRTWGILHIPHLSGVLPMKVLSSEFHTKCPKSRHLSPHVLFSFSVAIVISLVQQYLKFL